LAGVTVRALHHYDRMGLLKARRTGTGYRSYNVHDLERLEQIVALKFLGIPLRQMKGLLDRECLALPDALRRQRLVLEEKRRLLDRAIAAIRKAEERPDSADLRKIIEVIEMQNNTDWFRQHYSEEARQNLEQRAQQWTPELQEQVSRQWAELFRDVEMILDQDPAGQPAQALAARWQALVRGFTGGDPGVAAGLRKVYADRANWPADIEEHMRAFSDQRIWEFMGKALGCAKPANLDAPPGRHSG